jgi:hypothetical protein
MNYFNKYKKYNQKIINQLGGSKGSKRLEKEIDKLKASNLYKNIVLSEDKKSVTFTRISDNANITVIIPDNYPFEAPSITINETKYNIGSVWSSASTIGSMFEYDKKVLILCHNTMVNGKFEPLVLNNHWYGSPELQIFQRIFAEYNLKGKPIFETIDIIPGGTYQADAFSDEFINQHINDYDIVMVPDCGGPWYYLQNTDLYDGVRKIRDLTTDEVNVNKEILIKLCLKLTKVVKQGGIIQFSKFISEIPCTINGSDFDTFSDALTFYLTQNGFTTQIKIDDKSKNIFLIAIKQ